MWIISRGGMVFNKEVKIMKLFKKKREKIQRPGITLGYLKDQGINLTVEQYDKLVDLEIFSLGKYSAYEVLRTLKILGLI